MYTSLMPRASRRPIKKELRSELAQNFASLISSLSGSSQIESFFGDFLTKEENLMLTKRLMLHIMLESNYKSVDIQRIVSVSKETVRVHSDRWGRGGKVYRKTISAIARKKKTRDFLARLEKTLKPFDLFLEAKSNMRSRAIIASGNQD